MERGAMAHRHAHHAKALGALLAALTWLALGALPAEAANTVTTVTYVYTNAQGTPLAKANAQGTITARYTYRPYGTQQSGPTNDGPGYTGHVHDPETGLVYMQQRYYDPEVGRFISPDPVAPKPGNVFNIGRYTYASANPYKYIDPLGLFVCSKDMSEEDCKRATKVMNQSISRIDEAASNLAQSANAKDRQAGNDLITLVKFLKSDNAIVDTQFNSPPGLTQHNAKGKPQLIAFNLKHMDSFITKSKYKSNYANEVAAVVAHEAFSAMRAFHGHSPANTWSSYHLMEYGAFKTQSYVNQGLGTASAWGLWSPRGGRSFPGIEEAAVNAANLDCRVNPGCGWNQ